MGVGRGDLRYETGSTLLINGHMNKEVRTWTPAMWREGEGGPLKRSVVGVKKGSRGAHVAPAFYLKSFWLIKRSGPFQSRRLPGGGSNVP